jgi:hypothetical protein
MLKEMTRARLIQVWFAGILLFVAACTTFGMAMTVGTGAVLFGLSLVPPALVLMLWPGVQPQTVAEVLYGTSRRD